MDASPMSNGKMELDGGSSGLYMGAGKRDKNYAAGHWVEKQCLPSRLKFSVKKLPKILLPHLFHYLGSIFSNKGSSPSVDSGFSGSSAPGGSIDDLGSVASIPTAEEKMASESELVKVEEEIRTLRQVTLSSPLQITLASPLPNPLPSQLPSLFPSPFPSPLCNVNFSHFKIYKVLQAKLRRQNDLKRKLGITQLDEIKSDINVTLKTISESDAFVKTSSTLKTAGQKTGEVLSVAGQKTGEVLGSASVSLKGKLGEMRNSPSFQSFGSSVNNTWTRLKRQASTTMRTSQSANDVNGAAAGAGIIENGREPEELIKGD